MQAITTIVARAKLRPAGYRRLDAIRGMLNRLYNAALEQRKLAWQQRREAITRFDQFKWLTGLRQADLEGLEALALGAERGMLIRLDNAFQSFFRRCRSGEAPGFPRFRPLQRMQCIDVVQVSGGMVRRGKKGYVLRIKGLPHMRLHPARGLPEGRLNWQAIRRQQRATSRCRRGSRTRRKRVQRLAGLRERARVRNRNACHPASTRIVRRFGGIAVEALRIRNMTASARGTAQEPGRKVRAKAGLNRSILAQTWGILRDQLRYKAEWTGREFVAVNPAYTSRECHACGHRNGASKRRVFRCSVCGLSVDRDLNAAINIRWAGNLALASGTCRDGESVGAERHAEASGHSAT